MSVLFTIQSWFLAAYKILEHAFHSIMPEFDFLGVWIVFLAFFLFVFYLFKSGLGQALRLSSSVLFVLLFLVYSAHVLYQLVTL